MSILKSILTDLKSWDRILLNKWHLHAPIAFKIFVPSFLGYCGLWCFEMWQGHDRIIGELERFESDKDYGLGSSF